MKYAKTMVFNSTGQCVWKDKKKKCILCKNSVPSGNKIQDNIKLYNTLEMKTKCLLSKKKKEKTIFNKISTWICKWAGKTIFEVIMK